MSSLSELIYQSSSTQHGDAKFSFDQRQSFENDRRPPTQPPHSRKRPRVENDAPSNTIIYQNRPKQVEMSSKHVDQSNARETALNAYYFGDDLEAGDQAEGYENNVVRPPKKQLVTPPIVVSSSTVNTAPPRRRYRRPGRVPYKRKLTEQELQDNYYETPEQAIERGKKMAATMARKKVRIKWQTRRINMANEIDVGGAIATLARESYRLEKKQRKQRERKRHRQKINNNSDEENETPPPPLQDVLMDSSDEERENALGSLLRTPRPRREDTKPVEAVATHPNAGVPNEESDDYFWQLGYTAPPKDKLPFDYTRSVSTMDPAVESRNTASIDIEDMYKAILGPQTARTTTFWSNLYFPLSHEYVPKSNFVHSRQLLQLASRYIVGRAGDCDSSKANMDQRLLRLLFQKGTRKVSRLYLLLTQAREVAHNLLVFRQHKWKQSKTVAAKLGVAASQEFGVGWIDQRPPPCLSGVIMERDLVQRLGERKRRALIVAYGQCIPMEWSGGMHSIDFDVSNDNELKDNNDNDSIDNAIDNGVSVEDSHNHVNNSGDTGEVGATGNYTMPAPVLDPCNYSHLPGTTPPVPYFPLDEAQVIFGVIDRHAHALHICHLEDSTYRLTLCSLLSHWILALEQKSNDACTWWDQIQKFIEQAPNLNASRLYKRLLKYNKRIKTDNFPLVSYYNNLMGYCSLLANLAFASSNSGGPILAHTWDDSSETDDDNADDEYVDCDYSVVARTIHDYCESHVGHNALQHFPKLHTIHGLVSVAKVIPPSAAEIISSPLDDLCFRTPFDVMRLTLEHMEEEEMLLEVDNVNSNFGQTDVTFVNAGELEYALHKASEIFANCVLREPLNVDHHSWYLSALSGCLLLCSGCRFGGEARRFPSGKASMYVKSDDHVEIRRKMPTFDQVRTEVALAFRRVVELADEQNGYRPHLAVSSFLEWKQVVALLLGPNTGLERICKLHSMHVLCWADSNPQELSHRYVAYLRDRSIVDANGYLAMLAGIVENDPSQTEAWTKLIAALGPVGVNVTEAQKHGCLTNSCQECARVGRGLNVDHDRVNANKRNPGWWGKTRLSWWLHHQLSIAMPRSKIEPPLEAYQMIDKHLQASKLLHPLLDLRAKIMEQPTRSSQVTHDDLLSWLSIENNYAAEQPDDALEQLDSLPVPFRNASEEGDETDGDQRFFSPKVSESNKHLAALCHKVIVTCHLYNNTQENVTRAVEYLAQQCVIDWKTKKVVNMKCDEWRCLVWLSSFGLNVGIILKIDRPRFQKEYLTKFTPEQREAVRIGIERFGVGRWSKIKMNGGQALEDLSTSSVKGIYLWLRSNGKLHDVNPMAPTTKAATAPVVCIHQNSEEDIASVNNSTQDASVNDNTIVSNS